MIKMIVAFLLLFAILAIGQVAYEQMTSAEKCDLTKIIIRSIITSVIVIAILVLIVVLF
jgi:hypothetical protein